MGACVCLCERRARRPAVNKENPMTTQSECRCNKKSCGCTQAETCTCGKICACKTTCGCGGNCACGAAKK